VSRMEHDNHTILTIGGEDGCIKSQFVNIHQDQNVNESFKFKLPDRLSNPRKVGGANDEIVRTVIFHFPSCLIMVTDFGRILSAQLPPDCSPDSIKWTQLAKNPLGTAFTPCSLFFFTWYLLCRPDKRKCYSCPCSSLLRTRCYV